MAPELLEHNKHRGNLHYDTEVDVYSYGYRSIKY